jgi:tetratricopeptide (TPR) repeat protein
VSTVGLALIVRDEEETLPQLLASIEGAFDQVVLVDTGSEDRTVAVFRNWARKEHKRHPDFTYRAQAFEWIDDFAAARTYADSFLKTDWTCWADADDVIRGAENLRGLAAGAPADLQSFIFGYDYARDANGNCACYLVRERLVRRGAGEWLGRVHESQLVRGRQQMVSPDVTEWVHNHPPDPTDSNERNIRILEAWVEEAPEDPRVVGYLGTELMIRAEHDQAGEYFERYLALKTGWDEERAQIHRKLGVVRIHQGRHDEAIDTAMEAMRLMPQWPDSYLTLAEAYHEKGEWAKAIEWAGEVLRRGQPQTMLIVNPMDYTVTPRLVLASSLGQLGRLEEALAVAEEVLAIVPDHLGLQQQRQAWIAQGQREATAQTWAKCARQLVNHDEQLKALRLIEETVPHFAQDHAEIVALRTEIRERVYPLLDQGEYDEHYVSGGSKPEDFIPDEKVDELGAALPRCGFLLEGVLEQLGAPA